MLLGIRWLLFDLLSLKQPDSLFILELFSVDCKISLSEVRHAWSSLCSPFSTSVSAAHYSERRKNAYLFALLRGALHKNIANVAMSWSVVNTCVFHVRLTAAFILAKLWILSRNLSGKLQIQAGKTVDNLVLHFWAKILFEV